MSIVHVFVSAGRFRSFDEMREFLDETYTEDGEGVPSPFMREIGLASHEPACIEAMHSGGAAVPLHQLLADASYATQWVAQLPAGLQADAAICVFEPNVVTQPRGSSLTYVGAFEWNDARHTLYAYVDGSDLSHIADEIESMLDRFVESRTWHSTPWVVNQAGASDPQSDDVPGWDLGLNLALPDPGEEPPGWFDDIADIAQFLVDLRVRTGRDFIIGIADSSGIADDLYCVDEHGLDLEQLRKFIGVR